MRWMMVVVAVAGAWWLVRTLWKPRRQDQTVKSEV